MAITMQDRNRLRAKQDRLLRLAAHLDPLTHIADSRHAPKLGDLRGMIWPSYEASIDDSIKSLERQERMRS